MEEQEVLQIPASVWADFEDENPTTVEVRVDDGLVIYFVTDTGQQIRFLRHEFEAVVEFVNEQIYQQILTESQKT